MLSRRQLLIAMLASISGLAGCGYQLRGTNKANGQQAALPYRFYLSTQADADIVKQTKRVLAALGATFVEQRQEADYILVLGQTSVQLPVAAIGAYGDVSARLYIMKQPLQIYQPLQDVPIRNTVIQQSRELDMRFTTENIGGAGAEGPLAHTRNSKEVAVSVKERIVDGIVRTLQGLVTIEKTP